MWVNMPREARQKKLDYTEIVINCSINNKFSHHYKKNILMEKALKTLYHCEKKAQKKLSFFKNTRYEDCTRITFFLHSQNDKILYVTNYLWLCSQLQGGENRMCYELQNGFVMHAPHITVMELAVAKLHEFIRYNFLR